MAAPDGYVISLEVADAARACEQAKSMNLDFAMGLKEESWGQIHFMLEDPAGPRSRRYLLSKPLLLAGSGLKPSTDEAQ